MPAYNQPYSQHQGQVAHLNPSSMATFVEDDYQSPNKMYEDDHSSTANLALAAAPFAQQGPERPGTALPNPYGSSGTNGTYVADPHDVYQGRAIPSGDYMRRSPQPQTEYVRYQAQNGSMGVGYGTDIQEYPNPILNAQSSHSQSFSSVYPQTHSPEDTCAYDYDGQGYAEQGYHHDGGGYVAHAM